MKLKPFVCDTQTVFLWARGWFKWEAEWDRRGFLLGSRISLTHIKVNHDDLNDSSAHDKKTKKSVKAMA